MVARIFFCNSFSGYPEKHFEYVATYRSLGVNFSILVDLKTLAKKRSRKFFLIFFVDMPFDLYTAMMASTTDKACEQVGAE